MGTFGLGHDVVDVAAFAEQLSEPGSRMRSLFSVLAAKWAGKEAFLKAWCDYLGDAPYPFTLDNFPWPEIEILDDSRGVPHVSLGKGAASVFQTDYANSAAGARYSSAYSPASDNGPYAVMQERRNARSAQRSALGAGSMPHIHISLSHDGSIASAVVTISVE